MNQGRKKYDFVEKALKNQTFSPGKLRIKLAAKSKAKILKTESKKGRISEIPFLRNTEKFLENQRNSDVKERTRSGSSRSVHPVKAKSPLLYAKSPQPSMAMHKKDISNIGLISKKSSESKKIFKITKTGKVKLKTSRNPDIKIMTDEFNTAISDVDLAGSGYLNYSQFSKVLKMLNLIENSCKKSGGEAKLVVKAWNHLKGHINGKIKVKDLYNFLLSVLIQPSQLSSSAKIKPAKFVLSPKKQVSNIQTEFQDFYLHRVTPKAKNCDFLNSSSSQEISTEIQVAESPKNLETGKEEAESPFPSDKIIRRISLKELSSISSAHSKQISTHQTGPSICETPKNISSCFSDNEDLIMRKTFSSPKDQSKNFIFKIEVRRVNSKGESDFSKDFNSSISRASSFKAKQGLDECSDFSSLNNSELNVCQTAFKKFKDIPVIFEGQAEDIKNEVSEVFIENLNNNA